MHDDDLHPEHARFDEIGADFRAIHRFLEDKGSEGVFLGEHVTPEGYHNEVFLPLTQQTLDVLYDYFEIDPMVLEAERREMLEAIRQRQEETLGVGIEDTVSLGPDEAPPEAPVDVYHANREGKVLAEGAEDQA